MGGPEKPFGDREEVKKDVRFLACVSATFTFFSLVFAALGVIGDALNIKLGLQTMSWFLLAIFFVLVAHIPNLHSLTAKHLYGIGSEK
jgi:hypothetical protein